MKIDDFYLPQKKWQNVLFFTVLFIIVFILAFGITNLQIDDDITVLLPVNKETRTEREKIKKLTGEFAASDSLLFVAVDGDPFEMQNIESLWNLCQDLDKLEAVQSSLNPFNGIYFRQVGNTYTPVKLPFNKYPKNEKELDVFLKRLTGTRYLQGTVISYNLKSAGIVVRMNKEMVIDRGINRNNPFVKFYEKIFGRNFGPRKIDRAFLCDEVMKVLKKYDTFEVYIAGIPAYESFSKRYMTKDIILLILPAGLMMLLSFFFNFRSTRGTFLPITSMLLSMFCTLGIAGWMRYKLNIVGILIPPIIMTIGSSYTLHYLNSYYLTSPLEESRRKLVIKSTNAIFPTISIAALTTMIGFASFFTAKIIAIKMFGIFIIISISFTLFFTFFLLSKILSRLYRPTDLKISNVKNDLFSKFLNYARNMVYPCRFLWIGIYVGVIILFSISIWNINIETNVANFFKRGDIVKRSLNFIQENYKGITAINITIRHKDGKEDYFRTPEGLKAASKIQKYIDNNVEINNHTMLGWNLSPVTLLEDLNYIIEGEYKIPEDQALTRRFLSMLKAQAKKDEGIRSIINNDFSAISFQVKLYSSNEKKQNQVTEQELAMTYPKMLRELKEIAREDGNFTVEVWGEAILLAFISKYLVRDQVKSLIFTALLVFMVTIILFRSPYFAFASLIPLSFGVLMNFTIMSLTGIPLSAATVMIAALSIGIGIDDSIHFILHYKKSIGLGMPVQDAIITTLKHTSRPILFTSLALIGGFLIFMLSSFRPVMFFGLLISISMLNCTFATLFILPSFFIVTDKIRLLFSKK